MNSSTNLAQAQMMKALTKRNFNLPKRRTKPLQKHKNDQTTEKRRKILQNLLRSAPHNKQPRQERLATPRSPNLKPSTSSGLQFRGLPLTHHPKKNVDLQLHLSFNGLPPTHHPKKNVDHLQSYTEAGMTLRQSQTYSHRNGSKANSKEKFGLIDRDPVGVSLAGKHTNCLTYFSIPRYLSQQELGVWRVVGGECGQGATEMGSPKWASPCQKHTTWNHSRFHDNCPKMHSPHMTRHFGWWVWSDRQDNCVQENRLG